MNAIIEQINSTGKAFIDFAVPMLVQSGVLIVVLLGLDLILRRKIRAVFRYWIWMIVLLKLVLPTTIALPTSPVYWFGDELHGIAAHKPIVPEKSQTASPIAGTRADTTNFSEIAYIPAPSVENVRPDPTPPLSAKEVAASPTITRPSMTWQGMVLLLWLAVVTVMALLLVQRTFFVRGLVAQSENAGGEIVDILEHGRRQMGIHKRVVLKLSPVAASPSVCGLFHPTILIPQSLANRLDSKHLKSIILHELAHIKRRDLYVSLIQAVLQTFYFYNPLLWIANAKIRKVREEAVDEMVLVAMGEQAEDYPKTLLDVSRLTFSRAALSLRLIGVVESKKALAGRIRHITSRPFPLTAKLGTVGLIGVIVAAAVLLPMARAQKNGTAGSIDTASTASVHEGQLNFHKPLPVGILAGASENPEAVKIDWIRFEKMMYTNAWGVTARVGWLPAMDASWRLRVELLDEKGRVLRHSRDEATVFTAKAGGPGQASMRYADLALDPMQDQGRRHAKRFRIHLEPWKEQAQSVDSAGPEMHALEVAAIDQESRAPIADATVVVKRLYFPGTYTFGTDYTLCSTDSQGRCHFEFSGSELSSVRVSAQKPGFVSIAKSWSSGGSSLLGPVVLARLPRRHVLEMVRTGAIGGIVRNTEGKAIEGVEVRLDYSVEEPSGTIWLSPIVQTDANGRWQVDGIPVGADSVTVELKHAEYGGDNGRSRRIAGQAMLDALALKHIEVLKKGHTIAGKVHDDRGKPVTSATVMLAWNSGSKVRAHAITDESGAFELTYAVDTSANRKPLALIAEAPGYAPAERMLGFRTNIDPVEFRLKRGRSVSCRVVDTSGKPIVGAATLVYPLPGNMRYGIWLEDTDEQGEFQVPNAPANDVRLSVLEPGYISVRGVVVGQSENEVVITMKRGMRVHGTVTDAQSDRPIPNFEIAAVYTWQNMPRTSNPAAFAEGTYGLTFDRTMSEPLQLQVSAVGYEPATSQEFSMGEGQGTVDFKLARSSTYDEATAGHPREEIKATVPRRVSGVVRDEQGNPVSNAVVSARPRFAEEAVTNDDGAFTLRTSRIVSVPGGTILPGKKTTHLIVRHKERNLAAVTELDDDAETVDIQLTPGAILSGRVVDVEGNGIPDAEINLSLWSLGSYSGTREETQTNAEGYYEIRAIPSGHKYSITATAEGYGQQYVLFHTAEATADRMELEPLVLAAANLAISGVLVDTEDKPVAGAQIYAYGPGQPNRHFTTDANGKFVIENMCKGRIVIEADTNTLRRLQGRVETEGGTADIRILMEELNPGGRRVPRQPSSLLGKVLPDLTDMAIVFSPKRHEGKMILVCFWDMGQRPSRNCINRLADRVEHLAQKGVTVVAIQALKMDEKALDIWVRENSIPFPVGTIRTDHEKTRTAWGVESLPWLILTDRNHVVRAEGFGLSELDGELEVDN